MTNAMKTALDAVVKMSFEVAKTEAYMKGFDDGHDDACTEYDELREDADKVCKELAFQRERYGQLEADFNAYRAKYAECLRATALVFVTEKVTEALEAVQKAERERAVPEGWQLVPKKPPREMIMEISMCCGGSYDQIEKNWPRMLAAGPKPPTGETK